MQMSHPHVFIIYVGRALDLFRPYFLPAEHDLSSTSIVRRFSHFYIKTEAMSSFGTTSTPSPLGVANVPSISISLCKYMGI